MELLEEILKKQTFSRENLFRIVYGDGLSDTGVFQVTDFAIYLEDTRRDFILKIAQENRELLEEFLRNVYMAVVIGAPFVSDNTMETNPREVLLRELLLWSQWGIDKYCLPIYQVAFALIYCLGFDAFGYRIENYQNYKEEYRAKVIQWLCANDDTVALEAFLLNARDNNYSYCTSYTEKWKRVGLTSRIALLHELSNWCAWGGDISAVTTVLWQILCDYLERQDCSGFTSAFCLCGKYLSPDMLQSLRQAVLQTGFYNAATEKTIKNVLGLCTI